MSQSNGRNSDQDTVLGTLETFEKITRGVARLWSKARRKRGLITAVVLLLLAAGLGYETRSFVSSAHSGPPGATTMGGEEVGMIDSATITSALPIKTAPPHRDPQYMVLVDFPDPRNSSCNSECQRAISDVMENEVCIKGKCSAQFKNLDDQNGKNNSTVLQADLGKAVNTGAKLNILFSGTRKTETSDYPNILLAEPSSD